MATPTQKRMKAEKALETAKTAEIDEIREDAKASETTRVAEDTAKAKEAGKPNTTVGETVDIGDSPRITVIVERKFSEAKHRIFAQTRIEVNGKPKLVPFRIPVGVEVDLPLEIIEHLKQVKEAKFEDGKQVMKRSYSIEKV